MMTSRKLLVLALAHILLLCSLCARETEAAAAGTCAPLDVLQLVGCLANLATTSAINFAFDMFIDQPIDLSAANTLSIQSLDTQKTLTFNGTGQFIVNKMANCSDSAPQITFYNLRFQAETLLAQPVVQIAGASSVGIYSCTFEGILSSTAVVDVSGFATQVNIATTAFNNNLNSADGGLVRITTDFSSDCNGVTMTSCTFSGNNGGALHAEGPALTISSSQFIQNTGSDFVDIEAIDAVDFSLTDTSFYGPNDYLTAPSLSLRFQDHSASSNAVIVWSGLNWTGYSYPLGENVNPVIAVNLGPDVASGSFSATAVSIWDVHDVCALDFSVPLNRVSTLDFQLQLTDWQVEVTVDTTLFWAAINIDNQFSNGGLQANLTGMQFQSSPQIQVNGLDYFQLTNSNFQNGDRGVLFVTDSEQVYLSNNVVHSTNGSNIFSIVPCLFCLNFVLNIVDTNIFECYTDAAPISIGYDNNIAEANVFLNFNRLALSNCSGQLTGGIALQMLGVEVPSVNFVLSNSSFSFCYSATQGGALSLAFPTANTKGQQQNPFLPMQLIVQNSYFFWNRAVNAGGAIYMYTNASELAFNFTNDSFIANCALFDSTINSDNFGPLWSPDTLTIDESACFITVPTSTFSIPTQSTSSTLSTSTTTITITTTTTTTSTTTTTTAPVNDTRYICLNVDPPIYVQSPADCVVASSCPSFRCCSGACVDRPDLCLDSDSFCSSKANTPCGYSLSSGSDQICWDYCPSSNSNSSKVCLQSQWPDCESSSLIQYTPCPGSFNVVPFVAPVEQVDIPVFDYSGVVIAQITLSTGNSSDVVIVESYQPNSTKAQKKVAKLRSPALSITLASGQTKDLVLTITLILNSDGNNTKYRVNDLCLAYVEGNESDNWKCEDFNLEWMEVNGSVYVVGKSDHLTNFAALLGGGSLHQDFGYTIASLALIGGAIVLGLLICFFPPLSRLFYGKRGYAAKEIRSDIAHGKYDSPSSSHSSTAASTTSTAAVAAKTEGGEDRSSSSSDPSKSASSSASPFLDLPIVTCEDDI